MTLQNRIYKSQIQGILEATDQVSNDETPITEMTEAEAMLFLENYVNRAKEGAEWLISSLDDIQEGPRPSRGIRKPGKQRRVKDYLDQIKDQLDDWQDQVDEYEEELRDREQQDQEDQEGEPVEPQSKPIPAGRPVDPFRRDRVTPNTPANPANPVVPPGVVPGFNLPGKLKMPGKILRRMM